MYNISQNVTHKAYLKNRRIKTPFKTDAQWFYHLYPNVCFIIPGEKTIAISLQLEQNVPFEMEAIF